MPDTFALAVDAMRRDDGDGWTVRAEVVGPRISSPAEVRDDEARAARRSANRCT